MFKKATRQQTKEHNRNLVLKTIFERESISRADIARATSLTRTTVSEITFDLLAEGLIAETGIGPSSGGKSPILLSILEDSRYLIGLDLAHSCFSGAVVNLHGKICTEFSLPVENRSGSEALTLVYTILDQLMAGSYTPLVGIGVGTPGLVNTAEGTVVNAVNLDWQDLPLAHLLQDRYHLPVYVLNDSQAAAMGEFTYGKGRKIEKNLLVVSARHGIGSGIVIDGHLFQGDGGGAGEIGHIVIVPEGGKRCRCGNYGCLETVASAQALIKQAQALAAQPDGLPASLQEISLEGIEQAFVAGDPRVRQMVLDTARYMGLALAGLVGALNIQKIVLNGDMTCFGQPWLDTIRRTLSANTLPRLARDTQVEIGQLGADGVILGASALLANNYSLLFNQQPSQT
jgi:glucokinase-like ROK family protein